jgi:predicted nucleotide-binding protein
MVQNFYKRKIHYMDIYITYRRIDAMDLTGRIYDRLAKEFGSDAVFRDFEGLGPADDFGERMLQETTQCKVLVVVIGLQWLQALDQQGNRKIDNPADWIHREIAAFLKRPEARIFPVLVHGAYMPQEAQLPPALAELAHRFAIEVRGGREFHQDMTSLVEAISKYVKVPNPNANSARNVFLVHGHDEGVRESVARFVEKLELPAIVLLERPNLGRTIIEKFEQEAKNVGYAIILLTPDDLGGVKGQEDNTQERARQNVIFELGYFISKLGRNKVCLLYKGNVEIPSDLFGVLYIRLDDSGAWRFQLAKEMRASGVDIDLNNV